MASKRGCVAIKWLSTEVGLLCQAFSFLVILNFYYSTAHLLDASAKSTMRIKPLHVPLETERSGIGLYGILKSFKLAALYFQQ